MQRVTARADTTGEWLQSQSGVMLRTLRDWVAINTHRANLDGLRRLGSLVGKELAPLADEVREDASEVRPRLTGEDGLRSEAAVHAVAVLRAVGIDGGDELVVVDEDVSPVRPEDEIEATRETDGLPVAGVVGAVEWCDFDKRR